MYEKLMQIAMIVIPAGSLVVATGILLLNMWQTRLNNALVRAKMVSDCLHIFTDDEKIQIAFYKIEYDKFEYDKSKFHGSDSDEEKEIDKLLRHFSNLALMWKNELLSLRDIQPIQYYILRITRNEGVKKYFKVLGEWLGRTKIDDHPYDTLIELSEKLEAAAC